MQIRVGILGLLGLRGLWSCEDGDPESSDTDPSGATNGTGRRRATAFAARTRVLSKRSGFSAFAAGALKIWCFERPM